MSVQGTATAHAGLVAEKEARPDKLFSSQTQDIGQHRQGVIQFVQDAIAVSLDRQELNADNVGRSSNEFEKVSLVLLATHNLPRHVDLNFGTITPAPRFADPPTVLERLMCNTSHLALMAQRGRRSGASQLLEHGDTVEQPHQLRSKLNFDVQSDLICVGVLVGVLIANELGD
ncbi:hypothetical protein F442_22430 [Phytophthora nicotianae P10297]|uniref:Uncharacterized protein n=4 Tax=Phytophthora nicotianae TaxID=4792 RepID=W2Y0Y0_PHYNI|nr:hypothetical protein F442_22430 [Phytophthora nicotianae P10297]